MIERIATLSGSSARAVALTLCLLACALSAVAQQTTGGVRGLVTDPNGAVVPGAKITISSQKLNYRSEATTTSGGEYEFRDVIPGEYQITIEAANFKTLTLKPASEFRLVGKEVERKDIPSKTDGSAIFGLDVRVPGMVYAMVERCPVFGGKIKSFDASKAKAGRRR